MKEFTIGEIAHQAGIQTSAIRYYESVGLLLPPRRLNGRRRYDARVLHRLEVIQLARQAGFGISELQVLFRGVSKDGSEPVSWRKITIAKVAELDALVEQTLARKSWLLAALEHQCVQPGDCPAGRFDGAGNCKLKS